MRHEFTGVVEAHRDLDQFYALLALLSEAPGQGQPLSELSARTLLPTRGIYFFFEPGEFRVANPTALRIVRVGTHALRAGSKSTLHSRLKQHLGTRTGGGNHRCSIFRLHVGDCLLARDQQTIATWGKGATAPQHIRESESEHEKRVSEYIGKMGVLWLNVPDEPSPRSERGVIERNGIALLSNRFAPADMPSENWLGRFSPKREIRESALWNINHVDEAHDPRFLKKFERFVHLTCRSNFPLG